MKNWVDRYVAAVINHLPENEQDEVKQELTGNIYDMLPDDPSEEEVKQVLERMGAPEVLAEEYRQNPRYLISPKVYNDYLRLLKLLVPIMAIIGAIAGIIDGGVEAFQTNRIQISEGIQLLTRTSISNALSAAMQTLIWVTIGYVIAERTGMLDSNRKKKWTVKNLPEPLTGKVIPISDPVAEIIATCFFCGFLVLEALGKLPFMFSTSGTINGHVPLFSHQFASRLFPIALVCILLTLVSCGQKIVDRRWTKRVSLLAVLDSLLSGALWIFLFSQRNIFSSELIDLLQEQTWSDGDILHYISTGDTQAIQWIICGLIVLVTVIELISILSKTAKQRSMQATIV
ncbi:hypothetical protein NRIC_35060 [Enterococcus florum]|uniref:Uncharacterized protein n=1 Tax=Enterococcus florum TaxID=2480627 RepID=A0A4P5PBN8_9ENTE|nr:hypothetical protein [Enterococcus florum]GCF95615.1 hypothetical protein NRIC_35060 [Enterococcus florum]